jgi:hypothetical protein
MNRLVRISIMVLLLAASIAVFACSRTVVYKGTPSHAETAKADKPGPPPHAPAHGYRHKHGDGVVLVYDSDISVYVVSGYKDVYYYNNNFYRMYKNRWQSSRHIDGPWRQSTEKNVPPGLQQHVAEAKKGNDKSVDTGNNKNNKKDNGKNNDKNNGKNNGKNSNENNGKAKGNDKDKDKDN